MKIFEYCFITFVEGSKISNYGELIFSNGQVIKYKGKTELANVLDDLGKKGWEIVGCGSTGEGLFHNIYFKREIEH